MSPDEKESSYDIFNADFSLSTEKAKDSKKTLRRLLKVLSPQRWTLIASFLFATGSSILFIWSPLIFAAAVDVIVEGITPALMGTSGVDINFARLGEIVFFLTGIYLLSSTLLYFQEYLIAGVSQKVVLSLRESVSEKLSKVPLQFYDTHEKGEILSRVTNDLERLNEILQTAVMRLFTAVINIAGAVILMFWINWILTLVAISAILVGIIITGLIGIKSNTYFTNRQRSLGIFNTRIEEYFSGQLEIKAFTLEDEVIENTEKAIVQLYKDDKKAQFIMYAIMPIIRLVNHIGYVVIAALGAVFVIQGIMSIGQIQAFFQYVQISSEPMTEASYIVNSLQSAIASAERVFDLLDEEEEVEESMAPKRIKNPKGEITFENVQFGYGDALLMDGVSFDVQAGQKVAIVGATGAGKTTLVNLIMRFYEIRGGSIKVDGIDIRDFERQYVRSLFGMVLQDSWIFDGTVSENIAYGRNNAMKSEIVNAAKMAMADHFILTMPNGYESIMNDESSNLSQGQKQLLCIARVILADPYILLLDEATSSVDTRTEVEIQNAMDNLMRGRTSFVIAHRLSTIKNADIILVMNKGDIVERGSHTELLRKGGIYSEIYNSQFVTQ